MMCSIAWGAVSPPGAAPPAPGPQAPPKHLPPTHRHAWAAAAGRTTTCVRTRDGSAPVSTQTLPPMAKPPSGQPPRWLLLHSC
mmetsp:Transcript_6363/g.14116  ORF Transcript_6363/g.14116 Transcript_6363/m.14116 type:complete len:83 (-) Transcript_6363:648-896(-)